jgi:hypothetical protein
LSEYQTGTGTEGRRPQKTCTPTKYRERPNADTEGITQNGTGGKSRSCATRGVRRTRRLRDQAAGDLVGRGDAEDRGERLPRVARRLASGGVSPVAPESLPVSAPLPGATSHAAQTRPRDARSARYSEAECRADYRISLMFGAAVPSPEKVGGAHCRVLPADRAIQASTTSANCAGSSKKVWWPLRSNKCSVAFGSFSTTSFHIVKGAA